MKKVLALVLTVLMLMGLACPVWANAEMDKHYVDQTAEIERILTELGELRAEAILDENERTRDGASVECRVNELESELIDLGVEILAQDEVAELMGKSGNARVTVPGTTNSVKWYSANVRQLYNGDPYTVQKVYAQGLKTTSTLCGADSEKQLLDSCDILIDGDSQIGGELLSIYVQKAIGMIPLIGWTPYELLFTSTDGSLDDYSDVNTAVSITYSYVTTVCFCFVCPADVGQTPEDCSYVSTSVNLAGTITAAGVKDGTAYVKHTDVSKTTNATNYASSLVAAEWYVNKTTEPTIYSYARKAEFRDNDDLVVFTLQFPTPKYFWEIG